MSANARRRTATLGLSRDPLLLVGFLLAPLLLSLFDPRVQQAIRRTPAPPPVMAQSSLIPRFPADGLARLIVTPTGTVPVLEVAGTVLGAVADAAPDVRFGHPAVDELAAEDGVVVIQALGDGSYALVANSTAVIDPTRFVVAEDVPMGLNGDPYEAYQWALHNRGDELARHPDAPMQLPGADIGWTGAFDVATGRGVTIAVIDSGIDFSHPDLRGVAWENTDERCDNNIDDDANGFVDDCRGWDFGNGDDTPFDRGADPHGTHVAGLISAGLNGEGIVGIAPRTRLMDLNVAVRTRGRTSVSLSAVAAAIRYAVDNGADIINLSLGTPPGTTLEAVQPMAAALAHAAEAGVPVVVAAGNNAVDLDRTAVYPASLDLPNMVVVGAIGPDDQPAVFTNRGAASVDLFAPGVSIVSTIPDGQFRFMSGTSQAAPIVAGSLALVAERLGDAPMPVVVDALLSNVEELDALDDLAVTGGRLDLGAALGLAARPNGDIDDIGELELVVSGFDEIDPIGGGAAAVDLDIDLDVPVGWFGEDYRWEAALATATPEGPVIVLDQPVSINGRAHSTGPQGAVRIGPAGVSHVDLGMTLRSGDYALLVDAVPLADPSQRLGPTHVVPFAVSADTLDLGSTDGDAGLAEDPFAAAADADAGDARDEDGTSRSGDVAADRTSSWGSGNGGDTGTSAWNGTGWSSGGGGSTWETGDWGGSGWSSGGGGSTWGTGGWGGSGWTTGSGSGVGTSDWDSSPTSSGTGSGVGTSEWGASGNGSGQGSGVGTSDWGGSGWTGSGATASPHETTNGIDGDAPSDGTDTTVAVSPGPVVDLAELRPVPTGAGEATDGEWSITEISPTIGRVDALDRITIKGSFPDDVYVWFDDEPGTVVHQSPRSLTVQTPLVDEPGIATISLRRSGTGTVLEVVDAFAFHVADVEAWVAEHAEAPEPEPTAAGGGTGTTTDTSGDASATPGLEATEPTGAGSSDGAAPSTDAEEAGPVSEVDITAEGDDATTSDDPGGGAGRATRASRPSLGGALDLGDGRTGAPLLDLDPFSGTAPCPGACRALQQ